LRVKKDGEFAADGQIAFALEVLGFRADDDQSRSLTGRPSNLSRTAPPTKYTCMRPW